VTTTKKTKNIKWTKSCAGGSRFAFLRSCKLVSWASGGYVVERVHAASTETIGWYATLGSALDVIDQEPEAVCFRCGESVVPGYQVPDPSMPCPSR
jgi:hypothetical protein